LFLIELTEKEPEKRPSFVQIFEELQSLEKQAKNEVFVPKELSKNDKMSEEIIYNDVNNLEMQVYN
jgi:hypothetical protein